MIIKCAFVVLVIVVFSNAAPVIEKGYFGIDKQLSASDQAFDTNPELGEYFEGDMLLSPDQQQYMYRAKTERNGLRSATKRWPNRTVVYEVVEADFDDTEIKNIKKALNDISNHSCLKFRERENDEHAVIIQGSASGCFSSVGYNAKKKEESEEEEEKQQVINLGMGCFKHGTIMHEMLHTIGFYHMQSTYDRDNFVEIVWENIKPGREHNFAKYTTDTVTDFDVTYDYGSVMHYPEIAFTKNGKKTIIPLQENVKIGQRYKLSEKDILKLNKMYNCDETIESNA